MNKLTIVTIACLVGMTACKRKVKVAPDFKNTTWVSEDGTRTLEFDKKNVYLDGSEMRDGKEVFYADEVNGGGQFWTEEKDEISYLYDYKISGENLFINPETTDTWEDPSSPQVENSIKFKQE